jgi:ketosteroid isomerase-like protein
MKLKNLVFTLLTSSMFAATAHADYVRFWRGVARPDLSQQQLIDGLNRMLFPATGELAKTEAKLLSYQPVISGSEAIAGGVPDEIALIIYRSEQDYRNYRSTAAGMHYGELHWELFRQDASLSLVPQAFAGKVEFERAYEMGASGLNWNVGPAYYQAWVRTPGQTDAQYLSQVRSYLEAVQRLRPHGYVALVAKDYVLENELLSPSGGPSAFGSLVLSGARRVQISHLHQVQRLSGAERGITYPVHTSTEQASVRQIWEHHIAAWNARDLDRIMVDYDEQSVVIRNNYIFRGRAEIRQLFEHLFATFDQARSGSVDRVIIEHQVVYIRWKVSLPELHAAGQSSSGTDTFVIDGGKIRVQTITSDDAVWSYLPHSLSDIRNP